jgi:hypothetical protein
MFHRCWSEVRRGDVNGGLRKKFEKLREKVSGLLRQTASVQYVRIVLGIVAQF